MVDYTTKQSPVQRRAQLPDKVNYRHASPRVPVHNENRGVLNIHSALGQT